MSCRSGRRSVVRERGGVGTRAEAVLRPGGGGFEDAAGVTENNGAFVMRIHGVPCSYLSPA